MAFSSAGVFLLLAPVAWAASGLTYSTYLSDGFTPTAIATDPSGNLYIAGSQIVDTASMRTSAMVVKLDPTATRYLYVRTFGGCGSDAAAGIAVDGAGNAYIIGTTFSPDFPATTPLKTGTLPAAGDERAFLIKLDPQGDLLFADVIGSVGTTGLAVALAPDGGILISGVSKLGLAATSGAYSVPNTNGRPFLTKIDPTGANTVFTATGIGGNALAVDSAGNIYMAGSTVYTDYPTTPGAYQTSFPSVFVCFGVCQITTPGLNQYVTKVDPAASKLIYSTGVTGQSQTINNGLAVDAAGNAYVTGLAYGSYPWTVTQPDTLHVKPFLTRLAAAGDHISYSVPVGGSGVALGSQGDVYVGGAYNDVILTIPTGTPAPSLPLGIASLPAQCQANNITTVSEGTITHLDAVTGDVLSTVLVDGSNVSVAGIALAGDSNVWAAGPTSQVDTPITPGALMPADLSTAALHAGPQPGAYLGQANFALSQPAGPEIACVTDNANTARLGVVAPGQLLSLFGSSLGPETGVAATEFSTTSLAGVTVTFDGTPAPLLYVSSTQINVAVPFAEPYLNSQGFQNFALMQVSVNGATAPPRALPMVPSNPTLFSDLSGVVTSCTIGTIQYFSAFTDLALNADGTLNSCSNSAKAGSVISLFLNGLGLNASYGNMQAWTPCTIPIAVTIGHWSAEVMNISQLNPFMWQIDALVPPLAAQNGLAEVPVAIDMNFWNGVAPVGPLAVGEYDPFFAIAGTPLPLSVWVSP